MARLAFGAKCGRPGRPPVVGGDSAAGAIDARAAPPRPSAPERKKWAAGLEQGVFVERVHSVLHPTSPKAQARWNMIPRLRFGLVGHHPLLRTSSRFRISWPPSSTRPVPPRSSAGSGFDSPTAISFFAAAVSRSKGRPEVALCGHQFGRLPGVRLPPTGPVEQDRDPLFGRASSF